MHSDIIIHNDLFQCASMTYQILSALMSDINFFDEVRDLFYSIPDFFSVINSSLPDNRFARFLIYGTGTLLLVYTTPLLLRHTELFDYHYRQMAYFHRCCPSVLDMKEELLAELKNDSVYIPKLYDEKLVILEINVGGGSNLMYYPEKSVLIATDMEEKYKEMLMQNFESESSENAFISHVTLDRFVQTNPEELVSVPDSSVSVVVCIHSLCQTRDLYRVLAEIRRVLLPKGRFYFIEHVQQFEKFTWDWFMQMRFLPVFTLVWCHVGRPTQIAIERTGFSKVSYKRIFVDFSNVSPRPIQALSPHIYGYAIN